MLLLYELRLLVQGFLVAHMFFHFHHLCSCLFRKSRKDWTGQNLFVLCLGVDGFKQVISMVLCYHRLMFMLKFAATNVCSICFVLNPKRYM